MAPQAGDGSSCNLGSDSRDVLIDTLSTREPESSQDSVPGAAAERFSYVIPSRNPYPCCIGIVRRHIFKSFILIVFAGTVVWLTGDYLSIDAGESKAGMRRFIRDSKLFSVPLVSLLFTWFHVWLALQMMFYPINFWGIPRRAIVPECLGLPVNGWQGIVPRKAGIMAERCCEKMIGNICTVEEFMHRVKPDHFWVTLENVFVVMCSEVLKQLIMKRWPALWKTLPPSVQKELEIKVMEETKNSFLPAIEDLKRNINSILDIKQMATEALANDPVTMLDMFRSIAARELVFITHVAAVMGFILGLVQVVCYIALQRAKWLYTDYVLLPVSGLIIGYFTNWLALTMTFKPIWPHMKCGNTVNFQGVFLKRQKEAADQMATLICEKVIDSRAMFNYIIKSPSSSGLDKVMQIYKEAMARPIDEGCKFADWAPSFVGRELETLKEDVVEISLAMLPRYTTDIERYMDEVMDIKNTLSFRLSHIPPDEFEGIIHPIFQEDEWILLCVGGFLGVVIGLLQAWALNYF